MSRILPLCGVIFVLAFGTDWAGSAARSLQTDTNDLDGPPRQVVLDAAAGRVLIATPEGAWFLTATSKKREDWVPRRLQLSAKPFPGRVQLAPGGGLVAELETRDGYAQEIRMFDPEGKSRGRITVPSGEPPYADLFLGRDGRLVVTVRELPAGAPPGGRWEYGFWGLSPADCKAGDPCKTVVKLPDRRLGSTDPTGQFIALIGEHGVDVYDRLGRPKGRTILGRFRDVELSTAAAQIYLFDAVDRTRVIVRDPADPENEQNQRELKFAQPVLGIRPVPGSDRAYAWTTAGTLHATEAAKEEVGPPIPLFAPNAAPTQAIVVEVLSEPDGSAWVTFKRRQDSRDPRRTAGLARVAGGTVRACLALQLQRNSAFVPALEESKDALVIWTFEEIRLISKSGIPTLSRSEPCAP